VFSTGSLSRWAASEDAAYDCSPLKQNAEHAELFGIPEKFSVLGVLRVESGLSVRRV
jgi:hypothetical protein